MSSLKELFGPPKVEQLKARYDIKGLIKALGYQIGLWTTVISPDRFPRSGAP